MNEIIGNKNLHYITKEIPDYFSINRISWSQFYSSERKVIERSGINKFSKVLDVGCACGGLGLALKEKFNVTNYTGIEINPQAIEIAKKLNNEAKYINVDILENRQDDIRPNSYDYVFSLSCVDWNVEFDKMLKKVFSFVKYEGCLIISLRLSFNQTIKDITQSYQFINYNDKKEGEIAPYIVLNFNEIIHYITKSLNISEISSYGYWGKPSKTAITPYHRLFFAVFSIKKTHRKNNNRTIFNFDFPDDVLKLIKTNFS